ncbi:peroxisomal NADH pyrophosphatase NUDT12 [Cololabis saira]|uniref:peroxisomal NADH pyrophosphatase NUDT12 n=1 Tax=Cololabis saira TaxID=129043 RepID=UPI002AD3DE6A|nr:peroxisomal NADH pyrophosphatase NUDT12 [Cololabis saira]XP_061586294.1 peroxisomal NADH pyrophosphatase NUDT12 [Cololabis saira]XP_061586295.1 peroxisomal NADH pyrophosphatase NUDT12 [Cololabis saira]
MTSLQLHSEDAAVQRLLDAAARGDASRVSSLLASVPSLINRTGTSSWTALMLAARNGHVAVVEKLLALGCERLRVNGSSQTAGDIARFWGHRHIAALLVRPVLPVPPDQDQDQDPGPQENFFSREPLDRLSEKRTDPVWLENRRTAADTVYLLFCNLSPLVTRGGAGAGAGAGAGTGTGTQGGETRLVRFRFQEVQDLVQDPGTVLVFLGVERTGSWTGSSSSPQPAWFALNTDRDPAELLKTCGDQNQNQNRNRWFPKNLNRELLTLNEDEAGVVAQARAVLAWHSRYSFCSTCGSNTSLEDGGWKRSCLNPDCRSRRGIHNTCYPRVDPVVIMLVVHPDQNQILLGRKKVFPAGMFSCLAGFVEPGEALESAVRREVHEEAGVAVATVQYVSCQPWPLPSSLMIGCLAAAVSTAIRVDESELEDARWFPRQQVIDSFRGTDPTFVFPPRQTIAHQLIKHWIGVTSNL